MRSADGPMFHATNDHFYYTIFPNLFICAVWSIDGVRTVSHTQTCSILEQNKQSSGLLHGTYCDNLEQSQLIDKMGIDIAGKLQGVYKVLIIQIFLFQIFTFL